jgi:hypothetical protein
VETKQAQLARDVVLNEVWAGAKPEAEVEWVAPLPQGRAEIASAINATQRCHTSQENLVVKRVVPNVGRE